MSAFYLTSNYLSSQVVSNQVLSAYKGLTEAANQNFDVFPKFFVSRFLSIAMLRSFELDVLSYRHQIFRQ